MLTQVELSEEDIQMAVLDYLRGKGFEVSKVRLTTSPRYDHFDHPSGSYNIKAEAE